jgi:hypothetical protein
MNRTCGLKRRGMRQTRGGDLSLFTIINEELKKGKHFLPVHVGESRGVVPRLSVKQPMMIVMKISTFSKQGCTEHELT